MKFHGFFLPLRKGAYKKVIWSSVRLLALLFLTHCGNNQNPQANQQMTQLMTQMTQQNLNALTQSLQQCLSQVYSLVQQLNTQQTQAPPPPVPITILPGGTSYPITASTVNAPAVPGQILPGGVSTAPSSNQLVTLSGASSSTNPVVLTNPLDIGQQGLTSLQLNQALNPYGALGIGGAISLMSQEYGQTNPPINSANLSMLLSQLPSSASSMSDYQQAGCTPGMPYCGQAAAQVAQQQNSACRTVWGNLTAVVGSRLANGQPAGQNPYFWQYLQNLYGGYATALAAQNPAIAPQLAGLANTVVAGMQQQNPGLGIPNLVYNGITPVAPSPTLATALTNGLGLSPYLGGGMNGTLPATTLSNGLPTTGMIPGAYGTLLNQTTGASSQASGQPYSTGSSFSSSYSPYSNYTTSPNSSSQTSGYLPNSNQQLLNQTINNTTTNNNNPFTQP